MTLRLALAATCLLSLTGCVAALPLAAQLMSGSNVGSQFCTMTKLPGQTASLCDRLQIGMAPQTTTASTEPLYRKTSNGTFVSTAIH